MRILALAHNLRPNSGWGRFSSCVIDNFDLKENSLVVLTEKTTKEIRKYELPVLLPHNSTTSFIRNVLLTRKYCKQADVVQAFDIWPYGVYAYLALLLLPQKKKLFMSGVGTYSIPPENFSIKKYLMSKAILRATEILSISNYTKTRILERVPEAHVSVALMGNTPIVRINEKERDVFEAEFKLGNRHPIILTVGEIKNRKGQLDTLKAVARLKTEYPDILYVVVGGDLDTNYVNKLKVFAKENNCEGNLRIISNAKDDKALSYFYGKAIVFALNSNNEKDHFEGFGLVFLEAASFGVPVIGSSGCGIEDALESGYNGYLTKQGDEIDIANKLRLLLNNETHQKFSKNSLEFCTRFSWEKTGKIYLDAYNR